MTNQPWTQEAVTLLKALLTANKSASQIVEELATKLEFYATRNAVIGKTHRLGMHLSSRIGSSSVVPTTRIAKPKIIRRARPKKKKRAQTREQIIIMSEPVYGAPLAHRDLRANQCRWPFGDPYSEHFHFCTEMRADLSRPYCREHERMAASNGRLDKTMTRAFNRIGKARQR